MNKIVMDNIDKGCMPTLNKYIKEQLIGAIIKYVISKDSSYFTDEYNARNIINAREGKMKVQEGGGGIYGKIGAE